MTNEKLEPSNSTRDWHLDVTDTPLLQGLAYVFPSILGGVLILAGALVGWLVIEAIRTGAFGRAIVIIVLAVLSLFVRRSIPAALLTTNLSNPFRGRFSRRGLSLGSVLGAFVLLASTRVHPDAPFMVFVASWVPLVVTAIFPTEGHADPATGILVVDGKPVPLDALRGYRSLTGGSIALFWLSYARGVQTAPRIVVVPVDCVDVLEELLSQSSSEPAVARTIGSLERWLAVLFGLGLLSIGPGLWAIMPPGDGRVIALYAGAMFGVFGLYLLWYAYAA